MRTSTSRRYAPGARWETSSACPTSVTPGVATPWVVTVRVAEPPMTPALIVVGLTVYEHAAAWFTVKVVPAMVRVPERVVVAVFAAMVNPVEPEPVRGRSGPAAQIVQLAPRVIGGDEIRLDICGTDAGIYATAFTQLVSVQRPAILAQALVAA